MSLPFSRPTQLQFVERNVVNIVAQVSFLCDVFYVLVQSAVEFNHDQLRVLVLDYVFELVFIVEDRVRLSCKR